MRNIILICITLLLITISAFAQNKADNKKPKPENHFNAFVNLGMATQIHSYPDIYNYFSQPNHSWHSGDNYGPPTEKEYGKYMEDLLFSYGVGFNYNYHLNNWISLKPQISYLQKGSSYRDIGFVGGIINNEYRQIYDNRFHYLSLDLLIKFNIKSWDKIAIYFQTGIRNNILLGYSLEYDVDMFSHNDIQSWFDETRRLEHTPYPENSGYVGFNNYTLGLANTLGLEFTKGLNIGFEMNPDLGYLVRNDKLKVRNLLFSINVGYRIKND